MSQYTYIYEGEHYTDTSTEFMTALGMSEETIESVLADKEYERTRNIQRRAEAYAKESDPLFLEALRKYMADDMEGSAIAKQAGLDAVAAIQARYPV